MKQEYKTHHENNIEAKQMHSCKKKGKKTIVLMTKKKKRRHCYEHEGYVMPDDFDVGKQKQSIASWDDGFECL